MRFYNPEFFYLFFIIPLFIGLHLFALHERKRKILSIGDASLVKEMSSSCNYKLRNLSFVIFLMGIFFTILALVRPQYGKKVEKVKTKGLDIMLVVDCSNSMLAEDIKPSRLEYTKSEIASFIDNLRGDRVGITAFKGDAQVVCPLTLDYSAVKLFLDILSPNVITTPGTNIEIAIKKAKDALMIKEEEAKYKVMVLITDGENLEGTPLSAVEEVREAGIKIFTVGIGTPMGEPIPIKDENGNVTEYMKDESGNVVMSKLDEETLQRIALITGGGYSRLSIKKVQTALYEMEKKEFEEKYETAYEDRFQYPLALAIMCFLAMYFIPERKKN